MLRPLGPVAVFGASNFPLAFSAAGGDTASALAAGNPVVVKAHPAHPGTSELIGRAVQKAIRECGVDEGIFSLLFDAGTDVGTMLVQHPLIKAGGFTGSRLGGMALLKLATARPEPIPFYAEMSSTNPVFILPGALKQNAEKIAAALHTSFTLGAGQFCTKPGLVFIPDDQTSDTFRRKLDELVPTSPSFNLLTAGIRSSYLRGVKAGREARNVKTLASAEPINDQSVGVALFETDAKSFLDNPGLSEEVFGPATLLIRHSGRQEVLRIANGLEGHLTATIHGTEQDLQEYADLIAVLERKVGRLVFNGFPTGVEVSHAMVHGGPFPATSDGRSTSVGSMAMYRFARPVCYQGFPEAVLPAELRDENPLEILRMIDGKMTRDSLTK
jgi:NADP-dependent aldehyde dehydrogenase